LIKGTEYKGPGVMAGETGYSQKKPTKTPKTVLTLMIWETIVRNARDGGGKKRDRSPRM